MKTVNGKNYVSADEMAGILLRIMSARAIGVVSVTEPNCFYARKGGSRKKDAEPCPPVMKRQHVAGMTCFEYERARNNDNAREWSRQVETLRQAGDENGARALEQEGPKKHELHPRKWGQRVLGTPFIRHTPKGETEPKLYVEMMISTGNNPSWPSGYISRSYFDPSTGTEYSLKADEPNSLADWLKPYERDEEQPHDFDYREFRIDHIEEVRHEGEVYVLGDPPADAAAA
jgi:hypothetical protein